MTAATGRPPTGGAERQHEARDAAKAPRASFRRVREWVSILQSPKYMAKPPTIQKAKIVLDAILTTALNEQVTFFHAGRGVRTPPGATKPRRIVTAEQYELIHKALKDDETMRLLVETDIESGLRWGELTELRVKDLDFETGTVTISRAVVELKSRSRPDGKRFVVKDYPKDADWRRLKLAPHLVTKTKDRPLQGRRGRVPCRPPRRSPRPAVIAPRVTACAAPTWNSRARWHR